MTTPGPDSTLEAEMLRAALELLPLAIVVFDAASGRLHVNRRAATLLEVDVAGSQPLPAVVEPSRPDWPGVRDALSRTVPVHQLELEVAAGEASRKLLVDTLPLRGGACSISLLAAPSASQTGDAGLAHLAHKLNNPLSTILMSAQLAASGERASDPERLTRLLGKIQDNARRCGQILDEAVKNSAKP